MKGFIFLYGSEILLRFVKTNAFINLEARHDITYVAVSSSKMMKDGGVDSNFSSILSKVEWIPFYSERHRRWVELFDLSCIRFMDRSSSFKLRHQEAARHSPERAARLEKRADPSSYESYRSVLETDMGLNPAILSLTLEKRPDFFVLPSALLDYITDDVLQIADALSIPTLMLVAGWDNLSSKGLIQHHPTVIGVWGEQSRKHGVEIQGVDPKSVHVIGAPHYEDFHIEPTYDSKTWKEKLGIPPAQTLILFAGSFHAFD